jgi:hypothetical protein
MKPLLVPYLAALLLFLYGLFALVARKLTIHDWGSDAQTLSGIPAITGGITFILLGYLVFSITRRVSAVGVTEKAICTLPHKLLAFVILMLATITGTWEVVIKALHN